MMSMEVLWIVVLFYLKLSEKPGAAQIVSLTAIFYLFFIMTFILRIETQRGSETSKGERQRQAMHVWGSMSGQVEADQPRDVEAETEGKLNHMKYMVVRMHRINKYCM